MKKFLSLFLTVALLLGMCSFTVAASAEEPMEIVFFDDAANYNGEQTGWFAKVVLDRFNIKLNAAPTATWATSSSWTSPSSRTS